MSVDTGKARFAGELSRALDQLYDPGALRRSPLIAMFGLSGRSDATALLQRLLIDGIAALKPDSGVPPSSNAWRLYQVLSFRYREGFTQAEVAKDLALGTRQIRRLEETAIEVLADHLWAQHDLAARLADAGPAAAPDTRGTSTGPAMPSREDELLWLQRTLPTAPVDACSLVQAILETIQPLLDVLHVRVDCALADAVPPLAAAATTVRHALLQTITAAARCAAGGTVTVSATRSADDAYLELQVRARKVPDAPPCQAETVDLALIQRLVEISGGRFTATVDPEGQAPFAASLALPVADRLPVVCVEDNADTLTLLGRYLAGTRYRFVGTANPAELLPLCEAIAPVAVVLDVMLSEVDGWALLGRLSAHPAFVGLPVVVCSILPEDQLAMALGASEFLRKPVSRAALLAALDRQVGRERPADLAEPTHH